jgi:hypothetical protein
LRDSKALLANIISPKIVIIFIPKITAMKIFYTPQIAKIIFIAPRPTHPSHSTPSYYTSKDEEF